MNFTPNILFNFKRTYFRIPLGYSTIVIMFVVSILLGQFDSLQAQYIGDESENGLKSVDIDGDGDLDVVSLSAIEGEFRVFINDSGTFNKVVIQSFPTNGVFTVNDFNNDGAPDVMVVRIESDGEYRILSYINVIHTSSTSSNNFQSNPAQSASSYTVMSANGVDYFRRQVVASNLERIITIESGDIAADGDMDIIYGHSTNTESLRLGRWLRGYLSSGVYGLDYSDQIRIDQTNSPPGVAGNINGIRDIYHLRLTDLNGDIYPDLVSFSIGDVYNPSPFNGIDAPSIHTYRGNDIAEFRYLEEDIGVEQINDTSGGTVTLAEPNGFEVGDLDGDGDPEMIIVSTNPSTGLTNILVAGDNANDTTFTDIEIPITLDDYSDFELVDTDNDGVIDQMVVLTNTITATDTTSTIATYSFQPSDNNGSGNDAFVLNDEVTLDEPSFAIVVVEDENGDSVPVTDSDDTSSLSPPPETTFTSVGLVGDESANGMVNVDIDGDGDEDVYSASNRDNVIRWFRNDAGSFTPLVIQTLIEVNGVLTAADFNGDGAIDLAVVDSIDTNNYQVWVYLNMIDPDADTGNNFSTSLTNSTSYTTINGFRRFLAATNMERITSMENIDLQNDSDRDIIFTQFGSSSFDAQQLLNTNNLSLGSPSDLPLNGSKTRNIEILRVADFNGDGIEDIVWVSAQGDPRVGTGSASGGGFNEDILGTNTVESASDIEVQDLDGDGDFEILLASTDDNNNTSVYIFGDNQTDNSFDEVEIPITNISDFSDFAITDTDGDGDLDLSVLTTDEASGTSQIINYTFADTLNDGSGTDAYTAGEPITIDQPSYELVIVKDSLGNDSIINDTDDTSQLIEKAGNVLKLDYAQGWNLIAQPGRQVESSNFFQTVESADIPIFFELQNGNSFGIASPPKEGKGYWVYYESDPGEVTVTAKVNNTTTVNIEEGWNLLGSGSKRVSVQVLYDLYPAIADDGLNIFSYNPASSSFNQLSNTGTPDSLRPGQGYYFEAPSALNDVDINGNKLRIETVQNDDNKITVKKDKIGIYLSLYDGHEQELFLNFSRILPMPPSMTNTQSWLTNEKEQRYYGIPESSGVMHYETDTLSSVKIRVSEDVKNGYLLVEGGFKVLPGHTLQLPYNESKMDLKVEWIAEADNNEVPTNIFDENLPTETTLGSNYPNPFNPITTIPYSLDSPQSVSVSVYNIAGQMIWTQSKSRQSAGNYSLRWDGSGFASGVYLIEFKTSKGVRKLNRMTLLK